MKSEESKFLAKIWDVCVKSRNLESLTFRRTELQQFGFARTTTHKYIKKFIENGIFEKPNEREKPDKRNIRYKLNYKNLLDKTIFKLP